MIKKQRFIWLENEIKSLSQTIIQRALDAGATDAELRIDEGYGMNYNVKRQQQGSFVYQIEKNLTLNCYINNKCGVVNTSDLSSPGIDRAITSALDMVEFTDRNDNDINNETSKLLSESLELDIYHPWNIDKSDALSLLSEYECMLNKHSPRIKNTGISLSSWHHQHWLSTSTGFSEGYKSSLHSLSAQMIIDSKSRQHICSYSDQRRSAERLQKIPSENLTELNVDSLETQLLTLPLCHVSFSVSPVLFSPRAAMTFLHHFFILCYGMNIVRGMSFLKDKFGEQVFPEHISIIEDAGVKQGIKSIPFDAEGITGSCRRVVDNGRLRGLFHTRESARRLNMEPSGNASGSYQLQLISRLTTTSDSLLSMLENLHNGLFVTEVYGNGFNPLTGEYSRIADGFWVKNGELSHAVKGVSIRGDISNLFRQIEKIGNDSLDAGGFTCGSVLFSAMQIGG